MIISVQILSLASKAYGPNNKATVRDIAESWIRHPEYYDSFKSSDWTSLPDGVKKFQTTIKGALKNWLPNRKNLQVHDISSLSPDHDTQASKYNYWLFGKIKFPVGNV